MLNCKLITVASHLEVVGLHQLVKSLDKQQFPYIVLQAEWRGFGTKLLTVRDYLIANPDITHFFFCDAYDVICLGTMEEALSKLDITKITFSAEKNIWPDPSLEKYYEPIEPGKWNFLNSGLYFAPRELFLALFDYDCPEYNTDDQYYCTTQYLFNENSNIVLDTKQAVFNSHSFISEGEYGYENGRLQVNGEQSVLVHSNGRTLDPKLDELVKDIVV